MAAQDAELKLKVSLDLGFFRQLYSISKAIISCSSDICLFQITIDYNLTSLT